MKNLGVIISIASLSLFPMVAGANQSSTHKVHTSTVTGCLSGPDSAGAYMLKSGAKEIDVEGAATLKDHVGQEVKLHGKWMKSGQQESEKTSTKESAATEQHFKARTVQRVAGTCNAGSKTTSSSASSSGSSR